MYTFFSTISDSFIGSSLERCHQFMCSTVDVISFCGTTEGVISLCVLQSKKNDISDCFIWGIHINCNNECLINSEY